MADFLDSEASESDVSLYWLSSTKCYAKTTKMTLEKWFSLLKLCVLHYACEILSNRRKIFCSQGFIDILYYDCVSQLVFRSSCTVTIVNKPLSYSTYSFQFETIWCGLYLAFIIISTGTESKPFEIFGKKW